MADFTLEKMFGAFASVTGEDANSSSLTIWLHNFGFEATDMPEGKGVVSTTVMTPTQILYAMLLRLTKVQSPTINGDPEQRVFIANAGKSLARGEREGQIKQSFTVSFFLDRGTVGFPSVNEMEVLGGGAPAPQEP
jgi:hypothetical protein